MKDYREAIALFKRSAALNPRYPRSWAGLTAAYALAGEAEQARQMAERLRMFAPNLDDEGLTRQFGRHPGSALREGLHLALPRADRWTQKVAARLWGKPGRARTGLGRGGVGM